MSKSITTSARIRPAALPAWERLQAALIETVPDCAADDRYVTDPADLPQEDRTVMTQICAGCPLLNHCSDYASTDRPAAGWWPDLNLTPTREKTA
ncbi:MULTISPECIES: hypothetical protein [unclassified Leucobacter]|uniref:hypothetical protein n=1 Tax=unclassified Leucobacter TaxID=2621730 RepID=UPI003019969B